MMKLGKLRMKVKIPFLGARLAVIKASTNSRQQMHNIKLPNQRLAFTLTFCGLAISKKPSSKDEPDDKKMIMSTRCFKSPFLLKTIRINDMECKATYLLEVLTY